MVGVAQERVSGWRGFRRGGSDGHPHFVYRRQSLWVNHYYLSVGGPPVKSGVGLPAWERRRAEPQRVSSWSARSEARTNELDASEDRRTVAPKRAAPGS